MKKTNKPEAGYNWTLGTLLLVPPIVSLFFTNLSTYQPPYDVGTKKYIFENFELVAEFGDWVRPAEWSAPHGIRILKRKLLK